MAPGANHDEAVARHGFVDRIVSAFLESNLALILLLLASALGITALYVTPREEDPQIVVPLADVYVQFPGRSAAEVERLVATPLEKILYQIDGVEYVYSMSRPDEAVITVRFFVGEDRERSLVKLYKKIDENVDIVPPGVAGWVVKPVEIDDVPIVTLTLRSDEAAPLPESSAGAAGEPMPDEFALRRVAEELAERLAASSDVSRAYVVGGRPRVVHVRLDADRLRAYQVSALEVQRAILAANVRVTAGDANHLDELLRVEAGPALAHADELGELIVGAAGGRLARLRDVARIQDGPAEPASYVRHGWGPARGFTRRHDSPGTAVGAEPALDAGSNDVATPAVTIAIAKKKDANAVAVADQVLHRAADLRRELVPDDMQLVVTRNYGLTADDKVDELVEGLAVAIIIVIALLTLALGWREAFIVALAVPVVFGLTLIVNELAGYTINRVTLFALILSLGLLVDDPIVDVENIARHFGLRGIASRDIVRQAVAEIRPPLITATLAVIVSFVPMFFITGMMGPYMRPMALNVPVAMLMSMVVAFTITPWLSFHMLKRRFTPRGPAAEPARPHEASHQAQDDPDRLRSSLLYRAYRPLMAPLLRSRAVLWAVLAGVAALTAVAAGLAALRVVPLKMLPFDNKNELLLVLDFDEGTTLERSDAAVRAFEQRLARVPEVSDYASYVGVASPMDFNGLVRHYYLRRGANVAEVRVNLVGKRNRVQQSHAIGLRLRDELTVLARAHGANLKLVELPPGPPVIATLVAEIYGRPDQPYEALLAAGRTVRARLEREPGVADVDDVEETPMLKRRFVADREKAALSGVTVDAIAATLRIALGGEPAGTIRDARERNPLRILLQLPEAARSTVADLSRLHVKGRAGTLAPLAELGQWEQSRVDQTIYHKNLERVVYVFAETAGRAPAEAVVDIMADQVAPPGGVAQSPTVSERDATGGFVADSAPRALTGRTFVANGGGIPWSVPEGIRVAFAGEGEWKITLDVFRDLGIAFAAALVGIYILLVAQTGSFVIPVVVMLAIPLTVLGVMPGFWLLNLITGQTVGGYPDPVFFTATAMIGMIALAGIVTRNSIILIDFIHLALRRGRSLFDAILESVVVRLRPILLTAGAAMLGAAPITIDPIFSGLAWSLIFGLLASTFFTLFVIPAAYWVLYERVPGQGAPPVTAR